MRGKVQTIPALTGLRGLAAVWVLLYHLLWSRHFPVIRDGYLAVDAFFILSGFILSYVYLNRLRDLHSKECLRFLWSRLVRVYPVHFITLCITVALVLEFPARMLPFNSGDFSWDTLPAHFLLAQNWGLIRPGWNEPSWSLSAEWFGYFFFPILIAILARSLGKSRGKRALSMSCASLLLLAGYFTWAGPDHMAWQGKTGLVRFLMEFPAGCLLYIGFSKIVFARGASVVFALSLLLMITGLLVPTMRPFIPLAFSGIIFGSASEARTGAPLCSSILTTRPVLYLGEISYSLYMVQWIVMQMMRENGPVESLIWQLLTLVAVGSATLFLYYAVERPARSLGGCVLIGKVSTSPP